ncbi:asparagine synthase-related protein [Metabacillus sp. cB07]|uniref:asparagine synthase-related protein n=1 Tax=Metabacillus sp. cB07 TaxID=2806989 RepID=UPI00193A195C|nr:asparagine synthase-related protein [Metabacillus sp. cB07]
MSAIVGILNLNNEPVRFEEANAMMRVLERFPSDDVRLWHAEHVFLGCHAQWITPESAQEVLPYYDSAFNMTITADAIIDNRLELLEMLNLDRSALCKISDSELILMAYKKWGDDTPGNLIGDFAFAIWDHNKNTLFAARDFSGTRTLYYSKKQFKFVFSTILEPLFSIPYINKEINEDWIAEFIAIPFAADSVSSRETVYKDIFQIPPAHYLKIKDGQLSLGRYITFDHSKKLHLNSNGEYIEAFNDVFNRAVEDRVRTFKGIGSHLSGGLDSGSVASFAAKTLKANQKRLHTFSYVPVPDFVDWTHRYRVANEKPYIKETVKYIGNITDNYYSFSEKNPYSVIDELLEIMELPYKFFENSFWLQGIYEQAASHGIGILLNGQRGNWTISFGPALDHYAKMLKQMKFSSLNKEINQYSRNIGVDKKRILKLLRNKVFPIPNMNNKNNHDHFPVWINNDFANQTKVFEKLIDYKIDIHGQRKEDAFQIKINHFNQLHTWAINGTIGTKLSLKYSLWERDPTNDKRVVDFCLAVPDDLFVKNGLDRALIRNATRGLLPDTVRLNQRSRGVQGADGVHRMTGVWKEFLEDLNYALIDPRIDYFVDKKLLVNCFSKIKNISPHLVFNYEFRILMRFLILYKFLIKIERG